MPDGMHVHDATITMVRADFRYRNQPTDRHCAFQDGTVYDMVVVLLRAAAASCKHLIHLAIHCGGNHFFNDEASATATPAPSAYKSANNR